jgi:adenylate kinase
MERGDLVPDDVTIRMVMEWVEAHEGEGGFLLDGFPRTLAQAEALDREMVESGGIDRALYINVNTEELFRRLAGRWICRSCQTPYHEQSSPPAVAGECDRCGGELYQRDDDNAEAVQKRLGVFFKETEPLVQFYREAGILREVDGVGTVDGVGAMLLKAVRH